MHFSVMLNSCLADLILLGLIILITQGDSGEKFNVLGGARIGHCER